MRINFGGAGLFFCPHCGVEYIVGSAWKQKDICPICGNIIPEGRGFHKHAASSSKEFNMMKAWREKEGFVDPEPFMALCGIENTYVTESFDLSKINLIKEDSSKLKDYILKLFNIENNILSIKKRLEHLYILKLKSINEINSINERLKLEMENKKKQDDEKYDNAVMEYEKCEKKVRELRASSPVHISVKKPTKPIEPKYKEPNFFNKKKIMEENEAMKLKYLMALEEYGINYQQCLMEEEKENRLAQEEYLFALQKSEQAMKSAELKMLMLKMKSNDCVIQKVEDVSPEKAQQIIIASDIEEALGMLKKLFQARNELYAANIVYGKYRNAVALASFYEYLMSGRCSTLEGANGAYNLYESEVRSELIISKLTDIEKSLKRIEQNQFMMYSALNNMNNQLQRINQTMERACSAIYEIQTNTQNMNIYMKKIANSAKVIEKNTAVSAYYSKINAELTDALGFMIALK